VIWDYLSLEGLFLEYYAAAVIWGWLLCARWFLVRSWLWSNIV